MSQTELGVNQVAQRIHLRLRRYLEAQYHIRDTDLIEERRLLLEEPGGISQRPFVEVTPSYAVVGDFTGLRAPRPVTELLQTLAGLHPGVGVYPPYVHQAEGIERFFSDRGGEDLIVATGTGSGKTETFLYSVLGLLALEGTQRSESFRLPGVRALLLYPMNALVSDQTARLRKLLGDERVASLFRERWGRHPLFGMYTSRTPYPGVRSSKGDRRHLDALLDYYEALEGSDRAEDSALVRELKSRGRWPAKDVVAFYGRDSKGTTVVKSGKNAGKARTQHNWGLRFLTSEVDRELLTRHEMHARAPDLLITNYSMLEYMLLRPIERPLFAQTRTWLEADARNQLLLILDEAHMYRGVGGAEVSLLLRRLTSRLGIGRDRLRCILTSASMGTGEEAETAGTAFATSLTGGNGARVFAVIRGTREPRTGAGPGSNEQARALASVDAAALAAASIAPEAAQRTLDEVARALAWGDMPRLAVNHLEPRQFTCRQLTGLPPLELLLESCSGNATSFEEIAAQLFPTTTLEKACRATDGLLALGTFARRAEPGREEQPLLPTRVHVLFRGLPPLYICLDAKCTARRHQAESARVGRMYTDSRTFCSCGGRVFELLTHRDCGAGFLRAFAAGPAAQFFWNERGGSMSEFAAPLHEVHLFLEEPHPTQRDSVLPVLLDVRTGRVRHTAAVTSTDGVLVCYRPAEPSDAKAGLSTFRACPACTRPIASGGAIKIMDLATKGEQPFANLVREQFVTQLATKAASTLHPNEGRKALLFSDGRQKAARLARDLPREVERDSIREALVLAVSTLADLSPAREAVIDETLYAAFVAVCARFHLHFFDDHDQVALLDEIDQFQRNFDGDLSLALDTDWKPVPPTRYRKALTRQIGDPYYSLVAACAATVEARQNALRLFAKRTGGALAPEALQDLVNGWIREMLLKSAFDPALSGNARKDEFPYFRPIGVEDGMKKFFEGARSRLGIDASTMIAVRDALFNVFTRETPAGDDSGRLILPNMVVLKLALDHTWLQCVPCGHLQPKAFLGACANCADTRLEPRPPDHPYIAARKGFFQEPLRAVLRGERPLHITAEEHTAQLSQRDAGVVYATTEQFELRFQDVPLGKGKPPVDILSCTTTMEVGIDIGALTAVGLRTVPPQRENYQQRAGRAGRRGTSVSSVLTYAQGGAHDSHYFANPAAMISGPPRSPRIKSDNRRLARRHIHSHLLQTFFHGQLDRLPRAEQDAIAATRPTLLSAFGDAVEFFAEKGDFSYDALASWLTSEVLGPKGRGLDEIARWLPEEIAPGPNSLKERRVFASAVATDLQIALRSLKDEFDARPTFGDQAADAGEEADDGSSVLDLLFDRGLLPSYAFPTDLCSFVIQKLDKGQLHVEERPQLATVQALSEYAPGRLLVVNKRTYRVGGVFAGGPPTARPAEPLFARPLRRYVGCARCAFVRIEDGGAAGATPEGTPCPVCPDVLFVREMLDPPGFSPEDGRALREGDREQELTFASSAQLPELVDREDFAWREGVGRNLKYAQAEDVILVVANKGQDARGFSVCESCGGAWLDGEEPEGAHSRPFLLPPHVRSREGAPPRCSGAVRRSMFLGHEFRTDILLVRIPLRPPMDFSPEQPWLYDALATLSEALALGASLFLDVDPGDLSAGFRLLTSTNEDPEGAEVFLFDTASGGAGYSADAGLNLSGVLDATARLLKDCPANCERSCTKCLRHYGNRFLHARLDRRLALSLLRYAQSGDVPTTLDLAAQSLTLVPLSRFLTLEGWSVTAEPEAQRPLVATAPDGRRVVIGTYPALLMRDAAIAEHPLRHRDGESTALLPDFLVERDLPSAYQVACGLRPLPKKRRAVRPGGDPNSAAMTEFVVRDLRKLGVERGEVSQATARLPVATAPENAFAARVPSEALAAAGFRSGQWLVLRPAIEADRDGERWMVVVRPRGNFDATNEPWTLARVKPFGDDGGRLQLTFGAAKGKAYRAMRVNADEVEVVATVIQTVMDATED